MRRALAGIAIVGTLVLLLPPVLLRGRIRCLPIWRATARVGYVSDVLVSYRGDVGVLPSSDEGVAALQAAIDDRRGPYLRKPLGSDPWGRDYVYRVSPGRDAFVLYSVGVNGIDEMTDGDDVVAGRKPYGCADYGVGCWSMRLVVGAVACASVLVATAMLAGSALVGAVRLLLRRAVPSRYA